ncbi:MAG: sigma-54-dependent Fis family transcriptional regulator [Myxococcaceae bacterium]|nr:sigma-54-dependent Fis family transcriptional regulator [Myxococcaceae bacterium]
MLDILVVDDEPSILLPLAGVLRSEGHQVATASDGVSAMSALTAHAFDVVICDVRMQKMDGFAVFRRARTELPSTHVILMTAYATVPDAVTAMKEGALDYLPKPFDINKLLERLQQIAKERELAKQMQAASTGGGAPDSALTKFIGKSPAVMRLFERIDKFADSSASVLITGESGTGKELIARILHEKSRRSKQPFVAVNCGAFPETLIEAELFGHERGAFTGAVKRREGRFKAADSGTLFLDEVPELQLPSQSKLLRVLQEGAYEPLGTNSTISVDVRVISATHRNLKAMVSEGKFREDLFYRLNALELTIPPLRERGEDLLLLVDHFLKRFKVGEKTPSISGRALAALAEYPFPGNVRELEHAIEHAVVLAEGGEVDTAHLPPEIVGEPNAANGEKRIRPLPEAMREFERAYLKRVVQQARGKRGEAANLLGISRKNLWEKLRGYGFTEAELSPQDARK